MEVMRKEKNGDTAGASCVFALVTRQAMKEVMRLAEMDQTRDVETGQGENSELRTQNAPASDPQPPIPDSYAEGLKAELEEARRLRLESHRRALLAENTGRIVPELVAGSTVEELEGSVELARRAFETARAAALAEVVSAPIPAGNPIRQGPSVEGMSPLQKIAHGLRRD